MSQEATHHVTVSYCTRQPQQPRFKRGRGPGVCDTVGSWEWVGGWEVGQSRVPFLSCLPGAADKTLEVFLGSSALQSGHHLSFLGSLWHPVLKDTKWCQGPGKFPENRATWKHIHSPTPTSYLIHCWETHYSPRTAIHKWPLCTLPAAPPGKHEVRGCLALQPTPQSPMLLFSFGDLNSLSLLKNPRASPCL